MGGGTQVPNVGSSGFIGELPRNVKPKNSTTISDKTHFAVRPNGPVLPVKDRKYSGMLSRAGLAPLGVARHAASACGGLLASTEVVADREELSCCSSDWAGTESGLARMLGLFGE